VKRWAEEVPEESYYQVAADKSDNGILDNSLFAHKKRGFLEFEVLMKDIYGQKLNRGSQITNW